MTFDVYVTRDDRVEAVGYQMGLAPLLEAPDVSITFLPERDYHTLRPDDIAGANAVLSLEDLITAKTLEGADGLRVIGRFGAGLDNLDIEACTDRGIAVVNAPDGPRRSVAQSTLGMMLVCASNLLVQHNDLRARGFDNRFANRGEHLYDKQLGIVGFGEIGKQVRALVEPFDVDVVVTDPYVDEIDIDAHDVERVALTELLETSDFVSLHCGLTDETSGMLGTQSFETMKSSAYLINTSRGGIYPDAELAEAVREGWIAGAAVDVFEDEPGVEDNPLLALDDVLTTPHSAGVLREGLEEIGRSISDSFLSVRDGEVPNNIVNPAVYERAVPEDKRSPTFSRTAVGSHYRD